MFSPSFLIGLLVSTVVASVVVRAGDRWVERYGARMRPEPGTAETGPRFLSKLVVVLAAIGIWLIVLFAVQAVLGTVFASS